MHLQHHTQSLCLRAYFLVAASQVSSNKCLFFSDIQLLQKTVEVLQNSTIAVETAKDPLSKFWAAYKKVASEHDNEMLDRCNSNMDIVLIFVREMFHYLFRQPSNTSIQLGWSVLRDQYGIHHCTAAESCGHQQHPFGTSYPDYTEWYCHPGPVYDPSVIHRYLFFQLLDAGTCIREPRVKSSSRSWCCPGQAMARLLQDKVFRPWIT